MERPKGTITFVFTDIEGSSMRWERYPAAMAEALNRHNEILTGTFERQEGYVFKCTGDGYCVAFASPVQAIRAVIEAQARLQSETWNVPGGIAVRMGIHTGTAAIIGDDYFGPTLNKASRIMDTAHGGQAVVSSVVRAMVTDRMLEDAQLRSLGSASLPGLEESEEIFQIDVEGLRQDFPPLRSDSPDEQLPSHNLVPDERPFVGRKTEVDEICKRLLEQNQRLITIAGIGGLGKSRLAKEAGRVLVSKFEDGVWMVDCESLGGPDEVLSSLGIALGLAPGASNVQERLIKHLQTRRCLLIFDCFEHLTDHAGLISNLLAKTKGVSCLVTSRAVLNVPWEHVYDLGPMAAKRKQGESDAAELFTQAASHVTSFQLTPKNRPTVNALIEEVESVPLAIVLAAGRLRYLSLEELLERVRSSRLEVLRSATRPNVKHGSLEGVIQGSFELLSEEDRKLAVALSTFAQGFFQSDATAVLGDSLGVLDGLARLRDHSLLTTSIVQDRARFRTLAAVREYLAGHATGDEFKSIRQRHAEHYADRAAEIRSLFDAARLNAAAAELWLELANLRAAIRTSVDHKDFALTCRFASLLARVFLEVGATEFDELAGAGLDAADNLGDLKLMAELQGLAGVRARRQNDYDAAQHCWMNRLALCEEQGDHEGYADCLLDLCDLHLSWGKTREAESKIAEFKTLKDRISPVTLASGAIVEARMELDKGEPAQAKALAKEAEHLLAEEIPHVQFIYIWRAMADVYRATGDLRSSLQVARRIVSFSVQGHYPHHAGLGLFQVADTYEAMDRLQDAATCILAALAIPRSATPIIRAEARKRRTEFEAKHGPEFFAQGAQAITKGPWTQTLSLVVLAQNFETSVESPLA